MMRFLPAAGRLLSLHRQAAFLALRLLLLSAGLGAALQGLNEMASDLDLRTLQGFALGGMILAWLLASSRLKGHWPALLLGPAGAALVLLVPGRLGAPLGSLIRSLLTWLEEMQTGPLGEYTAGQAMKWGEVAGAWEALQRAAGGLAGRVQAWGGALSGGRPVYDPIVAVLLWSFLIWLLAAWAGWFARRGPRPLLALFPAGMFLAVGLYFTRTPPAALLQLMLIVLILKAAATLGERMQAWRSAGVPMAEIAFEWVVALAALCALLFSAASLVPSVSIGDIAEVIEQLASPPEADRPDFARSIGLQVQPRPVTVFAEAQIASLPARHLIGPAPQLSQHIVMWVSIRGYARMSPQALDGHPELLPPRYYGRSLTYDRYTGRGWLSSPVTTALYEAGEAAVPQESAAAYRQVEQEIRYAGEPDDLVYAAGELVTIDREFMIAWRGPGDALGAHTSARSYWATSRAPIASEAQLRAAGLHYPAWVRDRYLALPAALPERVRSLALDLTATQPTPYDQARAIERYLRDFPYSLDLPDPPFGRDVVDYFLFDLKQGYCDYYASAMVVLARAAGIPARLATGYVGDHYDPTRARFIIRRADAHSWPEVYFPGTGWVGFEPTARLVLVEGQVSGPAAAPPQSLVSPNPPSLPRGSWQPEWLWLFALSLGFALLGGVWAGLDAWRLAHLTPEAALQTIYRRLVRSGRRLPPGILPGATPYELAARLAGQVERLAERSRLGALLRPSCAEIQQLAGLYVGAFYSPRPAGKREQAQAVRAWRGLKWRLWLAGFMGRRWDPPGEGILPSTRKPR